MSAGAAVQLGRHRVNSVQDIPPPTGNPRHYLSGALGWDVPADTYDYQSFPAAEAIAAGVPLALRADGAVEPADSARLDQFNNYAGVAVNDAAVGGEAHCRRLGVMTHAAWAWQPGKPVFVGAGGQLTQDVPVAGYRQSVGIAMAADRIALQPWIPAICAASSNVFYRPGGVNGGGSAADLPWATVQEVRDGSTATRIVSPAVLKIVRDELIQQYGVIAARIADDADVIAGASDKIVMARQLKNRLDALTGGQALEYATTDEIRAGVEGFKAISPLALKPVLDGLGGVELEYATPADINLGVDGVKVMTPLAFRPVLNALRDRADAIEAAIPPAADAAEVTAGARADAYVSPLTLAGALADALADVPTLANHAEVVAGAPGKAVPADELKFALAAVTATIPAPATADDITAGTASGKYVTVAQLVTGLADAADATDLSDLAGRVTALEGLPALQWATQAEAIAGSVIHKAIDPATLAAVLAGYQPGSGGEGGSVAYATPAEALAGSRLDRAINPYTLAAVLAEASAFAIGEYGERYPTGAP